MIIDKEKIVADVRRQITDHLNQKVAPMDPGHAFAFRSSKAPLIEDALMDFQCDLDLFSDRIDAVLSPAAPQDVPDPLIEGSPLFYSGDSVSFWARLKGWFSF